MARRAANGTEQIVGPAEQLRLWHLARDGDRDAADRLVRCCRPKIHALAARYAKTGVVGAEKEDLEQIAMAHVYTAVIRHFRPGQGSFFNYAVPCFAKKMISAVRAAQAGKAVGLGDGLNEVPQADPPESAELGHLVRAALAELPPMDRAVLTLREGYGCAVHTAAEVATHLGMSEARVDKLHARAFNRLSDLLADLA